MKKTNSFTDFELTIELLRDPERKSLIQITIEILKLMLVYKTIPGFYLSRYLFKTHRTNVDNYFPNRFLHN